MHPWEATMLNTYHVIHNLKNLDTFFLDPNRSLTLSKFDVDVLYTHFRCSDIVKAIPHWREDY